MSSISISASLHRACCSIHNTKKQQTRTTHSRSKQVTNVVSLDTDSHKVFKTVQQSDQSALQQMDRSENAESSDPRFNDDRWKKGTWDLNMFVKDGKMDWTGVITAEANRRKFLEVYPEASISEEPVLFRSSIIPWWAWLTKTYLPEAELLNGRAAMIGFFMSYIVDALTGFGVVGQTGNFICKAAMFTTVIGIVVLRRTDDLENFKKLGNEAVLYDKQWQASWQDNSASGDSSSYSDKIRTKI